LCLTPTMIEMICSLPRVSGNPYRKNVSLLLNDYTRLVGCMDLLRSIHSGKEVVDLKSSYIAQHQGFTILQLLGYSLGEQDNTGKLQIEFLSYMQRRQRMILMVRKKLRVIIELP